MTLVNLTLLIVSLGADESSTNNLVRVSDSSGNLIPLNILKEEDHFSLPKAQGVSSKPGYNSRLNKLQDLLLIRKSARR